MLIADHYTILSQELQEGGAVFSVRLNPECIVYQGHFPGEPVSPGVCNIQMIRECAEQIARQPLRITGIKQCRMTALIKPDDSILQVSIHLQGGNLTGEIRKGEQICLTLKAEVE